MIAWRPTSLKAIACVGWRAAVASGTQRWTRSGCETAHSSTCMPPIEPPTAASSFSMPRWSRSLAWALTMSAIVMMGKSVPYGRPVAGPDHHVPPAGALVVGAVTPRHVRIAREGMGRQDGVVLALAQPAIGLV